VLQNAFALQKLPSTKSFVVKMKPTIDTILILLCELFVLAVIFFPVNSCRNDTRNEPWFSLAQKYIEADATMLRNAAAGKETAVEDTTVRDDFAAELQKMPAPPLSELEKLVRSEDLPSQKVALVNVMVREITETRLLESILDTYPSIDDRAGKFYALQAFKDLDDTQIKAFEDRIVRLLSTETDETAIIAALPTLIRLDHAKIKPLLTKYLQSGTPGFRATVIVSLKKWAKMYQKVCLMRFTTRRRCTSNWAGSRGFGVTLDFPLFPDSLKRRWTTRGS
jgi:hypothetical protein